MLQMRKCIFHGLSGVLNCHSLSSYIVSSSGDDVPFSLANPNGGVSSVITGSGATGAVGATGTTGAIPTGVPAEGNEGVFSGDPDEQSSNNGNGFGGTGGSGVPFGSNGGSPTTGVNPSSIPQGSTGSQGNTPVGNTGQNNPFGSTGNEGTGNGQNGVPEGQTGGFGGSTGTVPNGSNGDGDGDGDNDGGFGGFGGSNGGLPQGSESGVPGSGASTSPVIFPIPSASGSPFGGSNGSGSSGHGGYITTTLTIAIPIPTGGAQDPNETPKITHQSGGALGSAKIHGFTAAVVILGALAGAILM